MDSDIRRMWLWVFALAVLVGIAIYARTKLRSVTDVNAASGPSTKGGASRLPIFQFDDFVPVAPAPAEAAPKVSDPPLALENRSPARLGTVDGALKFEYRPWGAAPYMTTVDVDGFPVQSGYSVNQERDTVKISFDQTFILADGERHITVFVTDSTGKTGAYSETVMVANPATQLYLDGLDKWESQILPSFPDEADRKSLAQYMAVLRIRGEFGRIKKEEYQTRINGFGEAIKSSSPRFWQVLAGKTLSPLDRLILAKVYQRNWDKRMPAVLKLPGDFVCPFLSRGEKPSP